MKKQYNKYQVSLTRELQLRIKELFDTYPAAAKDYMRGSKYGYVKFIEEAIRKHIEEREEVYKDRKIGEDINKIVLDAIRGYEEGKKELEETLDEHSPQSKKKDS